MHVISATPESMTAWADKIDNRLGPLSGRDADDLAILLRSAAKQLAGIPHPTGSEQFQTALTQLKSPAPWSLAERMPGEIQAANGAVVLAVDHGDLVNREYNALALWIMVAINTCAGFRMEKEA
jgi:hypothetical protein